MTTPFPLAVTIVASPRPVLFLDACILLDIIRAAARQNLGLSALTSAITLRDRMRDLSPACYLVGSSILPAEFQDNCGTACQDLNTATANCDLLLAAGVELNVVAEPRPTVALITQAATSVAHELIQLTAILPHDPDCLQRAFDRILVKRQPARNGKIKDAYLLEQILALCQALRTQGFTERCILCSSNTSDFAMPNSTRFDQDISNDAAWVSLEYFTSLTAAVGSLRLAPTPRP
jgi:hypothetical protein